MKQNLNLALSLILAFAMHFAWAQNIVSGQVIDAETSQPIIGATIMYKGTNKGTTTDFDGKFTLESHTENTPVIISFVGYQTQTITGKGELNRIRLQQSVEALTAVVVSASRRKQKRTDVPVAISTLSANEISEAKATSTEQLVNKSPGVYMVDLGNEQHSMAIRQPLSFKSLFLYLEDGVPIRTTGIFNHNALLEMNMAAFKNIEIIRGPASSIYGSEAIGGAINFITKQPTKVFTAEVSGQGNNRGFRRTDVTVSNTIGKVGLQFSGNYAFKDNGYRAHSDYEKMAISGKVNYKISDKAEWKNSVSFVDYRSDMTGSLDSLNFHAKKYSSVQTFTNRDVNALRLSSIIDYDWNDKASSKATLFYRNNIIKQNPSYRIKDDYKPWVKGDKGKKNLAHSEVNNNSFNSYGALLQHSYKLSEKGSEISGGVSLDYSPSTYQANYISVYKSDAGVYESFTETDSLKTKYGTDLFNTAAYAQLELNPVKELKVTMAGRYDYFTYNFDNDLKSSAFSGAPDSKNNFGAFSPKLGVNYTIKKGTGIYANVSKGFVPPQVGELYRGTKVPVLEPAVFWNYEVGGLVNMIKGKLSADVAVYQLDGLNEIISARTDSGEYINQNVGKTKHQGIEFGVNAYPARGLSLRLSGTNAKHTFVDYKVKSGDFSNNEMPSAPRWITNSEVTYRPPFFKGFRIGVEWQLMGDYYMDEANTVDYDGFNVFHGRLGYEKGDFQLWVNVMNMDNMLYATSARKTRWGYSFSPGDPRTMNIGFAYNL